MKRRTFLAMSGAAGLAPLGGLSMAAEGAAQTGRQYYRLHQYLIDDEAQKKRCDAYLRDAAIPALNRLGIQPVGVFYPREGISPIYVLLPHASPEPLLLLVDKLLADAEFVRQAGDALEAKGGQPAAFKRVECSLLLAFKGMPHLETPSTAPGRVFQLRTYESPSVKTARKKIEMFNDAGEIGIFRRVGLHPVFLGETLLGTKMPNLTYMLGFNSPEEQQAGWNKFRTDPDWLKLKAMPEYADKTILCGITNLLLKPAAYSQI
jgi:hypothetical protein